MSVSNNLALPTLGPPVVLSFEAKCPVEGTNFLQNCIYEKGKPPMTTVYWSKLRDSNFRPQGDILNLTDIQRSGAGTYVCTAENQYSGKIGRSSQSMNVTVECELPN